jgi:hypothetical protein
MKPLYFAYMASLPMQSPFQKSKDEFNTKQLLSLFVICRMVLVCLQPIIPSIRRLALDSFQPGPAIW